MPCFRRPGHIYNKMYSMYLFHIATSSSSDSGSSSGSTGGIIGGVAGGIIAVIVVIIIIVVLYWFCVYKKKGTYLNYKFVLN